MSIITFKDAAYQILREVRTPLTAKEITKIAIEKNLIKTSGKTPVATMGARIYMDIKRKGTNSLFMKVEHGKFGLREWQQSEQEHKIFRKGSFKAAAYKVLKQENRPLSIQEITEIAKKKSLVTSKGKNPSSYYGSSVIY